MIAFAASPWARVAATVKYVVFLGGANLALLLILEMTLRLFFGLPHGIYHYRPAGDDHLLLPNAEIHLVWTPVPYTIKTNSLGLRGPEVTAEKRPGVTRIIALGDSVTEGFYVNNPGTYPILLEQVLRAHGCPVEVLNISRGGTSIDAQTAMLRHFGFPHQPDAVVLTFVSNDIEELYGKTLEEILEGPSLASTPLETGEWLLFARTALGELILDKSLEWRFEDYRRHKSELAHPHASEAVVFPRAENFRENAQRFLEEHARPANGIVLYDEFSGEQLRLINRYIEALHHLQNLCRARGIDLVFAYFPDYQEVYLPERRFPLSGMLRAACADAGIPFVNLLPAFRAHPGEVLHFAPRDFHPNAAGNRVIANAIAGFLVQEQLAGTCGEPEMARVTQ